MRRPRNLHISPPGCLLWTVLLSRHILRGGWRNPLARPASNPTILGNFMVGALARNLIKFEMYFSKMFVGGLSWQTTEGIYRTNKNQSALLGVTKCRCQPGKKDSTAFLSLLSFQFCLPLNLLFMRIRK